MYVIKTVARRGHLVTIGDYVIGAAQRQHLSYCHTPAAPVSHYRHTHMHTQNSTDTHKTFIEHLNVNLTFFGGRGQLRM